MERTIQQSGSGCIILVFNVIQVVIMFIDFAHYHSNLTYSFLLTNEKELVNIFSLSWQVPSSPHHLITLLGLTSWLIPHSEGPKYKWQGNNHHI
jgi:hypothetical protein